MIFNTTLLGFLADIDKTKEQPCQTSLIATCTLLFAGSCWPPRLPPKPARLDRHQPRRDRGQNSIRPRRRSAEELSSSTLTGYYDGTLFHRVIPASWCETGGFSAGMQGEEDPCTDQGPGPTTVKRRTKNAW